VFTSHLGIFFSLSAMAGRNIETLLSYHCLTGVMFSIVSFFSNLFSTTNYLFNYGLGGANGLLLMEFTSLCYFA
jgi:hypothetical protein